MPMKNDHPAVNTVVSIDPKGSDWTIKKIGRLATEISQNATGFTRSLGTDLLIEAKAEPAGVRA